MKRIISTVLGAAILLSLFAACNKPERPLTATELLDLGEKYLLELDYEQALVYFEMAIEIDPMNPRGYTGAAEAHIALGDTDSAAAVLQQGAQALPGNAQISAAQADLDSLLASPEPTPPPSPDPSPPASSPSSPDDSTPSPTPEQPSDPPPSPSEVPGSSPELVPPSPQSPPPPSEVFSGSVTVEGVFFDNTIEYDTQYQSYRDQNNSVSTSVHIFTWGFRFTNETEVEIGGNMVSISEVSTTGFFPAERREEYHGMSMRITGRFSRSSYAYGLSGPYHNENRNESRPFEFYYFYNPNGNYFFSVESYELLTS